MNRGGQAYAAVARLCGRILRHGEAQGVYLLSERNPPAFGFGCGIEILLVGQDGENHGIQSGCRRFQQGGAPLIGERDVCILAAECERRGFRLGTGRLGLRVAATAGQQRKRPCE